MKLVEDWRAELNRLWSVRVAIIVMLLASADQILSLFTSFIPPVAYAILSAIIIILRLCYQPTKDAKPESE